MKNLKDIEKIENDWNNYTDENVLDTKLSNIYYSFNYISDSNNYRIRNLDLLLFGESGKDYKSNVLFQYDFGSEYVNLIIDKDDLSVERLPILSDGVLNTLKGYLLTILSICLKEDNTSLFEKYYNDNLNIFENYKIIITNYMFDMYDTDAYNDDNNKLTDKIESFVLKEFDELLYDKSKIIIDYISGKRIPKNLVL